MEVNSMGKIIPDVFQNSLQVCSGRKTLVVKI